MDHDKDEYLARDRADQTVPMPLEELRRLHAIEVAAEELVAAWPAQAGAREEAYRALLAALNRPEPT